MKLLKIVKHIAETSLKLNANSTTSYSAYQKKAPKTLKKFKKHD